MPSPVYQWRNALRRNMAVNCSATRLNISWMAVVLPTKVVDILRPLGGISQTEDLILLGIHSTKYEEFLFWTLSICSSTSFVDIRPRNIAEAVRYRPCLGSDAHIMFLASNICWVSSGTVRARYCCEPRDVRGAKPVMKKWRREEVVPQRNRKPNEGADDKMVDDKGKEEKKGEENDERVEVIESPKEEEDEGKEAEA